MFRVSVQKDDGFSKLGEFSHHTVWFSQLKIEPETSVWREKLCWET